MTLEVVKLIKNRDTMSNFEMQIFDAIKETLDEVIPTPQVATVDHLMQQLAEMQKQLDALKTSKPTAFKGKKNHVVGKPQADRVYVLLKKTMPSWGKVPQQQADLATILSMSLETDVKYSEEHVFNIILDQAPHYPSLAGSKQDPTYLFRYYRGLKVSATHAGFIGRNFLVVLDGQKVEVE